MKSKVITSWSDEELFKLTDRINHKVVKLPSGDYMWKHNINSKWENHCESTFDTYDKPKNFMHYAIAKWVEELNDRRATKAKKYNSAIRKLELIRNSIRRSTAQKIREVDRLGLNLTKQELAYELGVSVKTINRALKGDYVDVGNSFGLRKPREVDSSLVYNINDNQEVRIKSKEYLDYVRDFNKKINKG